MSEFFQSPTRPSRDVPRTAYHVLLSNEERQKLVKLSRKWKVTGAEAFRRILAKVKA